MNRGGQNGEWEAIYARGEQLNRWPSTELISILLRRFPAGSRNGVKVLEIGCGAANNLLALASEGFDCYGFDISTSAIESANDRARRFGVSLELAVASFEEPQFFANDFDVVFDRAAAIYAPIEIVSAVIGEAKRHLRAGGAYVGVDWYGNLQPDVLSASRQLGPATYSGFDSGRFVDQGPISFFEPDAIDDIFQGFSRVDLLEHLTSRRDGSLESHRFTVVASV